MKRPEDVYYDFHFKKRFNKSGHVMSCHIVISSSPGKNKLVQKKNSNAIDTQPHTKYKIQQYQSYT